MRTIIIAGAMLVATSALALPNECRDPQITEAVKQIKAVAGKETIGDCNPHLYGGSWANKEQLKQQVMMAQSALRAAGIIYYYPFNSPYLKLSDQRFSELIDAGLAYVGPMSGAPGRGKIGNRYVWHIQLPNGYVMAVSRKGPQ